MDRLMDESSPVPAPGSGREVVAQGGGSVSLGLAHAGCWDAAEASSSSSSAVDLAPLRPVSPSVHAFCPPGPPPPILCLEVVKDLACSSPDSDLDVHVSPTGFCDDPFELALGLPLVGDCSVHSCSGWSEAVADLLASSSSFSSGLAPSALPPDVFPSHCPVRSSGPHCPPGNRLMGESSPDFNIGSHSFPPLPNPAAVSNSSAPHSAAGSARPVGAQDRVGAGNPDPSSPKVSWASLMSGKPPEMKLRYCKPSTLPLEGRARLSIPSEVALIGASAWENTIVGFFLDKLPFSLVNSLAHRFWDAKGLAEVLYNGNGFFFFRFHTKISCQEVLNGGPWYFGGRPLFLKAWRPGMNLAKDGCKRVPIWVHFFNIPLEYWTEEGLSRIASVVGIPLHADKLTASVRRLSYARICVEIGVDDPLPNALDLVMEDGSTVEIRIDYNWVPKKCSSCNVFGHLHSACKQRARQVWVPKATSLKLGACDSSPGIDAPAGFIVQTSSELNASVVPLPELGPICSPAASPVPDSLLNLKSPGCPSSRLSSSSSDPPALDGCGRFSSNSFALLHEMEVDHIKSIAVIQSHQTSAVEGDALSPCPASVPLPDPSSGVLASPIVAEALSSSSSLSSTPLLARRLNLVDELERKQGKQIKSKKMSRRAGSSKGMISRNPDD